MVGTPLFFKLITVCGVCVGCYYIGITPRWCVNTICFSEKDKFVTPMTSKTTTTTTATATKTTMMMKFWPSTVTQPQALLFYLQNSKLYPQETSADCFWGIPEDPRTFFSHYFSSERPRSFLLLLLLLFFQFSYEAQQFRNKLILPTPP
jgi:hypothetical protein